MKVFGNKKVLFCEMHGDKLIDFNSMSNCLGLFYT